MPVFARSSASPDTRRAYRTGAPFIVLILLGAGACGSHAASDAAAKSAADQQAAAAKAKAPPAPPPPADPPKAQKLASEILSVPDKAWVFSFEGSAASDKAKADCDARFEKDPAGRARCIAKARDAFSADAMEFTRDDAGKDVWVIYKTKNKRLIKVYSVEIEYGEQDQDSVQIKKLGHEVGKPLLFADVQQFKVKLGGEYSLELQDDKQGLLSYDARLGCFSTQ
jgi:hypothetical protein